jgi:hypothetical protein
MTWIPMRSRRAALAHAADFLRPQAGGHAPAPVPPRPVPTTQRTARLTVLVLAFASIIVPATAPPAPAAESPAYLDQKALDRALDSLRKQGDRVSLQELARTAGDRPVRLVTIAAADGRSAPEAPAVLVVGDPLGTTPLATRAAVDLCRLLLREGDASGGTSEGTGDDTDGDQNAPPTWSADQLTWYVVPALDPDGAARFFATPRREDGRNDRAVDDDMDGSEGEDGPDDLDGDGVIATMLVRHPDGRWLLGEGQPRLPREADHAKGEQGLYVMESEGRDDDGDGRRNEDGPGGVTPGRNFPHAYEHWTEDGGPWAASEPESRALLAFAYDHPGIGLILVLGQTNTLLQVPESDRQAEVGGGKHKLPEWMARRLGIDPEQEFTIDELVQMARDFTGRKELTAEDVMGFLDLGAAVNPNRRDLTWWNGLSEQYQDALKEAGLDGERVDPPGSGRGSVEEWGYYQFGVPSLAVDFWSVPKPEKKKDEAAAAGQGADGGEEPLTPDRIEKMSRDEFLALGEERIAAFLEESGAPPGVTPQMLTRALQGGMLTTARIAKMMRERAEKKESGGADPELEALAAFARAHPGAGAWLDWTEVTLPDGRQALVGGPAPFAPRTPPPAMVDSLLTPQLPLLLKLTGWLPRLRIAEIEVEPRGGDVYQVTAWVANRGRIPYPTFQGKRNRRPGPIVVTLEGGEVLEGRARVTIDQIDALGAQSCRWLVRAPRGTKLTATATAPAAGRATRTLQPEREGGQR